MFSGLRSSNLLCTVLLMSFALAAQSQSFVPETFPLPVPNALPNPDDPNQISQALLQTVPDYQTVCDTAVSQTCEVIPGTYQLVIYRNKWSIVEKSEITIEAVNSTLNAIFVVDVDVSRPTLGDVVSADTNCPTGTQVTGVITCTSIWRERDYPNALVEQAATGIGSDNDVASCFHLVGQNDPYETLEIVTTLQAVCTRK